MADKNKTSNVTRKQLVGVEKDRAYNRILLIATAIVVIADVAASNGVIHAIDSVVIPK